MKLLQKTIRNYLLYSVFVLLVAIPVFYIVIQNILRHEVDEELVATKISLKSRIQKALSDSNLDKINFLDENVRLVTSTTNEEYDSLSTIDLYDSLEKEIIPYRVIRSNFLLDKQPYLLSRRISLIENDDLIKSILKVEVILLVLLLSGLLVINRNLSKRIWRPFYKTLDKLQNYNIEYHTDLELSKSSIAEFDDLNKSLQGLIDRTHKTFLSQKEFTENASHEMQTPLAIFQSKLELLMQTSPLSEEQAGFMDQLADAGERMSRLNKSLVLLTKIENDQFPDTETLSLNDIVDSFVKQYKPQIEEKKLSISFESNSEKTLHANKIMIEILIGNLMGNSIRHNYQYGSIHIYLDQESLIIGNTGRETALDDQKIFMRFQKESTNTNSIGLGLEIAKKICQLYRYKLQYQYSNNLHEFIVHFG
ncbi:MAG: HAMP domain-containing sensor histidine kinase [Ferruginibacter sp.]